MEQRLKRLYRLLLCVLVGGVAGIGLVGKLHPGFVRDEPGGFLLLGMVYFVGFALWLRFHLARNGIPGAEFQAYVQAQPLMRLLQGGFVVFLLWKLFSLFALR